jgi:hypothetical protein
VAHSRHFKKNLLSNEPCLRNDNDRFVLLPVSFDYLNLISLNLIFSLFKKFMYFNPISLRIGTILEPSVSIWVSHLIRFF